MRSSLLVLGAPYCGSTLLGRLLDTHPRMACGGEFGLLGQAIANGRPCSCGLPVTECPFWQKTMPALRGRSWRDYAPADFARVRAVLGVDVLVDLSKSLCWRMARMPWSAWRREGAFIYLVRDSRAVIAADLRKGEPLDAAMAKHFKWAARFERFAARHPDRTRVMHYETLCTQPEAELRGLCQWLGVPFDAAMLDPSAQAHHFAHSSTSSYTKTQKEIRLDERWRAELSPDLVTRIEQRMRQLPLEAAFYVK
ncbi:MAG TPA: sulfotransferase [Candidatus Binatia bacterium]|nr:sulfotransferase [Candidatus Binatia bacterium]